MTGAVSDMIRPFRGLAGKVIDPPENLLNVGGVPPRLHRRVKEVTEAKNYHVFRLHRATWDKMEVKDVSS